MSLGFDNNKYLATQFYGVGVEVGRDVLVGRGVEDGRVVEVGLGVMAGLGGMVGVELGVGAGVSTPFTVYIRLTTSPKFPITPRLF